MKRKMKKFNEGGKTYDKETDGLFGGKIKYREDDEGRKYVAGNATPFERNPQEQRYYSKDDVKKGLSDVGDKISNFFGGKKETSKYDESKRSSDAGDLSSYHTRTKSEEEPRRQMTDYIKKSESKTEEEPTKGKTYVNEDYKEEPVKAVKKVIKKATSDVGFTKKDTRTTKDAGFAKKDTKTTKDEGFKKERPKSVVFKRDVFRDDDEEPASKPAAPAVRKVVKETVAKVSDKAANTSTPKAFDMKSGNKTVYGTSTTDVFKQNEERKRKAAADKAAEAEKKRRSRPSSEEMMSQSLGAGYKRGGSVRSASARADGCAIRGKTRA
jgi:hypothetical protein